MSKRLVDQFCVTEELEQRWPGWRVVQTNELPLGCNEEIHHESRLILISEVDDAEWATAHAIAHLELKHKGVTFTQMEEADADLLAGLWLDVEWDDIPMDGEPTVSMRGRR